MANLKFNNVTFSDVGFDKVVEGTNVGTAVFKRYTHMLSLIAENTNKTMSRQELMNKLSVINMIAYPNQQQSSHKLWAGKVISHWKRANVISDC